MPFATLYQATTITSNWVMFLWRKVNGLTSGEVWGTFVFWVGMGNFGEPLNLLLKSDCLQPEKLLESAILVKIIKIYTSNSVLGIV